MAISVQQFVCNPFGENTYLLINTETLEAALIDPGCCSGAEWIRIKHYVDENKLIMRYILLTHSHVDHIMGTGFATAEWNIGVSGSLDDMLRLPEPKMQAQLFGVPLDTVPAAIVHDVHEGDVIMLGNVRIEVIDVPGHSPHGLIYYLPEEHILFSGDVLFLGSIGRADFGEMFGCNARSLVEGIVSKLMCLPSQTKVYTGHGPQTTIGYENANNPYF